MSRVVSSKIYDLLKNVVKEDIENYTIILHDPNKKGEGYLGEIYYISLENKSSGEVIDLAVKESFPNEKARETYPIRGYYLNEIIFYSKVWRGFKKFQAEQGIPDPFIQIPDCFATSLENGYEKLAMENLRCQNFQTYYDKKKPFDDEHLTFILKEYGKFHAISFAYKLINPAEYHDLTKDLKDFYGVFAKIKPFSDFLTYVCQMALQSLDEKEDIEIIDKFKVFVENCADILQDKSNYQGNYSAVLHGDCWTNNIMLKYDKQKRLCDLRLLDFQIAKVGTPVSDLSYFLYSGGSKDTFDRLEHYLKVYHNSLLKALEDFGLNSENVYPFDELKKDWKQHCQTGFLMGLLLWRSKLVKEEITDSTDTKENKDDVEYKRAAYDQETFSMRSRDLIMHMFKNDFL